MVDDRKVTRSASRLMIFENEEFDFQMMRSIGAMVYGGAAIGECMATARRITDGDHASWVQEWEKTAAAVWEEAGKALRRNDPAGAREAFLRASMYYRAAEYYSLFSSPGRRENWEKSRDCFIRAGILSDPPMEPVEIPFEDMQLHGYFLRPAGKTGKRPTIIFITGFDGTAEELYFSGGAAALRRGCNALLVEGPGQTGMIHRYPDRPFRPDYEAPVTAAVDYLLTRPDVDPDRIVLIGSSFGGYFACRAVVHEKRIRACVANSPIVSLGEYVRAVLPKETLQIEPRDYEYVMAEYPAFRWAYEVFTRRFGVADFRELMERLQAFTYEGMEDRITCRYVTRSSP